MKLRTASRYGVWGATCVATIGLAQAPSLSEADRAAIQDLTASYARALSGCRAEEFADLFLPEGGYFASGFRGVFAGREKLIALVQSERHCTAPAGGAQANRPGGSSAPTVDLSVTPDDVRGVVHLGTAEYQDAYTRTPQGWRFASRTVILEAEKAAGLDAREMLAINELGGAKLGDYYEADPSGVPRLLTAGVRISVVDGEVRGRAFLDDGGYDDEVYEKLGPQQWRVKSSHHVPPAER